MTQRRQSRPTSSQLQPSCDFGSFGRRGYGPHRCTGFFCSNTGLAKTNVGLSPCSPKFLIDALSLWSLAGQAACSAQDSCQNLFCTFPGSDFPSPNNAVRLAGAPDPINSTAAAKLWILLSLILSCWLHSFKKRKSFWKGREILWFLNNCLW